MTTATLPTRPATTLRPALDVVGVTVRHPDGTDADGTPRFVTALDDVSLACGPGSVTAVLGPSGSGKSTLLSVVAGLVAPASGEVSVGGRRLDGLGEDERAALRRTEIGIVFQQPNLLPSLTAVDQLVVVAHLDGVRGRALRAARERALELLDRVGLSGQATRRPHQLSGGQRQRVDIARALMATPSVLLVDEPTSALDQERSREVGDLLRRITHEQGLATLLVTHDEALSRIADRTVHMLDGRLS